MFALFTVVFGQCLQRNMQMGKPWRPPSPCRGVARNAHLQRNAACLVTIVAQGQTSFRIGQTRRSALQSCRRTHTTGLQHDVGATFTVAHFAMWVCFAPPHDVTKSAIGATALGSDKRAAVKFAPTVIRRKNVNYMFARRAQDVPLGECPKESPEEVRHRKCRIK